MVDRLAVVTTLLLAACGGAHNEAKHAEPDPWAGYKGLYATSVVAIAPRTTAPVARTRAAAGAAPTAQAAPLPTLATNSNKGASSNVARGAKKKAKK
jgi:hypothetical protein